MSIRRLQQFMMYDEIENPGKTESKINGKEDSNNIVQADIMKDTKDDEKADQGNQQVRYDQGDLGNRNDQNEYMISIENGSAKWLEYEKEDTLQNITIKMRPGEIIAIVGQVGSGKSSLMNVILKELPLHTGTVKVCALLIFQIHLNLLKI